MADKNICYSIVIPTYNGAETLKELVERLHTVMDDVGESFEIIFVDDDSPDDSWEIISYLKP